MKMTQPQNRYAVVPLRKGKRSRFDLSRSKLFDCDMGQIIPIECHEGLPGDIFQIGNGIVIRTHPLVFPPMHEINVSIHWFAIANRLLWPNVYTGTPQVLTDGWEAFITKGISGDVTPAMPLWEPSDVTKYSLWDYMDMPVGVDPDGFYPVDFFKRGYNLIWNEYVRDPRLSDILDIETSEDILYVGWEKDRFTTAQLYQQAGTAPGLPMSGELGLTWPDPNASPQFAMYGNSATFEPANANTKAVLEEGVANMDDAITFDISDLRLAASLQQIAELEMRVGSRYEEQIAAVWNVIPQDSRMQIPDYIGGMKSPIFVSEVAQTSEDGATPQGNLAGKSLTVDGRKIGSYLCKEHCVIIGVLYITPVPLYQQGIDRKYYKRDWFDYYHPLLAGLSEQPTYRAELFANGVEEDNTEIFGWQEAWSEYKSSNNSVCGGMRDTFDYTHYSRQFAVFPELNEEFLMMNGTDPVPRKDNFAVPSEPGFIVHVRNNVNKITAMPVYNVPGIERI